MRSSVDGKKAPAPSVQHAMESAFTSLLSSRNPDVRRLYLSVTEQVWWWWL